MKKIVMASAVMAATAMAGEIDSRPEASVTKFRKCPKRKMWTGRKCVKNAALPVNRFSRI